MRINAGFGAAGFNRSPFNTVRPARERRAVPAALPVLVDTSAAAEAQEYCGFIGAIPAGGVLEIDTETGNVRLNGYPWSAVLGRGASRPFFRIGPDAVVVYEDAAQTRNLEITIEATEQYY